MMKQYYQTFLEAAHRVGNEKLMLCSSGNMSWKIGDKVLISQTGSWLPTLREDQIAVLDYATGESLNGVKPSIEHIFHLGILRNRPEMEVVLHFQSEYATAIACMKQQPSNFNVTAEIPIYLGREIPFVSYLRPGSPELAQAVIEAMREHQACMLSNHGQVVCGTSLDDAFQKACFLEMACRIMVRNNMNYATLTEHDLHDIDVHILGKK